MTKVSNLTIYDRSTIKHLRFPFSFFLMPVFMFALSQATAVNWQNAILIFIALHLFIFPSSNGYNSYQDKDESSIGGLKNPPRVTRNLFYTTLLFDSIAILLTLIVSPLVTFLVLGFIIMSRLYSYRGIRLKKFPVLSFLIVFIFQGAWVYLISIASFAVGEWHEYFSTHTVICMLVSSLFIGSMYPLTQIYQHEADKQDGVITISYKLGYMGTFTFSAVLFALATILLFWYFREQNRDVALILFLLFLLPVVVRIIRWNIKVKRNTNEANFENTMRMNLLSSTMMNAYFILLVLNNFYNWF
jgi:1,4-dihydroxy-2-naphthoate octaprenyltransferase